MDTRGDDKSPLSARIKSALSPPVHMVGIEQAGWGIWSLNAQFWLDLFGLWSIVEKCIEADDNDQELKVDIYRDQRLLHGAARLVLAKLAGDEESTMIFHSASVGIAWKRLESKHVAITKKAIINLERQMNTRIFDVKDGTTVGPWIDEWVKMRDELFKLRGDEITDQMLIQDICRRYPSRLTPPLLISNMITSIAQLRQILVEYERLPKYEVVWED